MSTISVYTDEQFEKIQKRAYLDTKFTPENVQAKILELPKLFTKYKKLYLDQRKILKNINTTIKKTRARKYKYYKFDYDYRLDNASEINTFVDGDDEMCELNIMLDRQEGIVEFLEDTYKMISKYSYILRSYVDLEKLRNGTMN